MPAYLENSNPRNAPLCERGGFVAQKNILPDDVPPLISMLRKASSNGWEREVSNGYQSSL